MFKFIDKFYKEEDSEANAEQGDDPGEFYMNDQSKDAEEGQQIKAKADEDAEQDQLVDQQANQENAQQVNQTGIPDQIKKGFERLKGISLDDIRVIFNSKEPAKYGALAYAMGNEIHIAPGQEDNLPHEVAHIVQQKQGKVKATKEENGQGRRTIEKYKP